MDGWCPQTPCPLVRGLGLVCAETRESKERRDEAASPRVSRWHFHRSFSWHPDRRRFSTWHSNRYRFVDDQSIYRMNSRSRACTLPCRTCTPTLARPSPPPPWGGCCPLERRLDMVLPDRTCAMRCPHRTSTEPTRRSAFSFCVLDAVVNLKSY